MRGLPFGILFVLGGLLAAETTSGVVVDTPRSSGWSSSLQHQWGSIHAVVVVALLGIIAVLAWNIRRRRRAERALRQSEQRHREFVELMVDGVLTGAPDGTITSANVRMCELAGRPRDELVGLHVSRLFAADTLNRKPLRFDLLDQGRTLINERILRRPDGMEVTVEMHSRRTPDGTYHSVYRDITERRQAEASAREADLRCEAFFQGVRDAILVADPDSGLLVEANRAAEELLGRSRGELVGMHQTAVHPPESGAQGAEVFRRHATGDDGIFPSLVLHRDGRRIPVEISSRTIALPDGRRLMLGIFRDVRERDAMTERLRQAEKLTALGQLAGGVAHDFNNQLTGILGYAELLARRGPDDEARRCIDGIRHAAMSAADLTRQLLAFARKGRTRTTTTDAGQLVRQVADLLRRSIDRRIEIRIDLDARSLPIDGDPNQLENALLNLGLNARDAMPMGGLLTFTTRAVALPGTGPGNVEITVADSGCGMDAATREHLFEPFFTTKEPGKGTGLGLAAVYGTVQGHGGSILVQSEPGAGTVFTIVLPLGQGTPAPVPVTPTPVTPSSNAARILVVDDEESVRSTTIDILRDLGYQAEGAADGDEAIARFTAEGQDIALVVLDLILPRQDGYEVFAALRRIRADARVLIASGHSLDRAAQRLIEAGAVGFLQKPYQYRDLAHRIQAALASD